jgi:hypothetical protein
MNGRITVEVREDNHAGVFVRNMEPYDAVRVLISTALALLEGRADVTFNEGSPLTDEEEQEIIKSMVEGAPLTGGDERGN